MDESYLSFNTGIDNDRIYIHISYKDEEGRRIAFCTKKTAHRIRVSCI